MKKIIFLLIAIFISFNTISQDHDESKLREKYEQLQKQIYELEENAKYHGDDEIVRKRNDLPPKLPKFEEWIKSQVENKSSVDEKVEIKKNTEPTNEQSTITTNKASSTLSTPQPTTDKVGANVSSIIETCHAVIDKKGNTRQICSLDYIEKTIEYSLLVIFIILNFIIYSNLKKYRFLVMSTPFDIFVKKEADDTKTVTNFKKYLIEFVLLIAFIIVYYASTNNKSIQEINYISFFIDCLRVLLICYFVYILLRFIIGFRSRCPSCKLQFASRLTSSHDEPRTTYEKRQSSGYIQNRERGITTKEYQCFNCYHEWIVKGTYDKLI